MMYSQTATSKEEVMDLEPAVTERLLLDNNTITGSSENTSTTTLPEVTDEPKNDTISATLFVGGGVAVEDTSDEDEDRIIPSSDLSNLNRRILIVTTAGLPWMTGTAVNPLLRAISLANDRPSHYVTLMIPWLQSSEERTTLYGTKHNFTSQQDQEMWIRQYCVDRCNCSHDVAYNKLSIQFWLGKYHESFGSIFPIEDICSTIPREEADICILEEPEHLNWFRVPASKSTTNESSLPVTNDHHSTSVLEETKQDVPDAENPFAIEPGNITTPIPLAVLDASGGVISNCIPTTSRVDDVATTTATVTGTDGDVAIELSDHSASNTMIIDEDIESLGWAYKFQHVVGILHTNYADYIRQYGMASMVTAPALNALSSLVVKAYCHKVIRLSETLPPLDITKEVTCNVHGVRHEFLERSITTKETMKDDEDKVAILVDSKQDNLGTAVIDDTKEQTIAPVYFIGKIIWAKGFERVLELQERYKMITNEYFPIDIYGGGKDEKEIQIAFFGRNTGGTNRNSSSSLNELDATANQQNIESKRSDEKAAAVFGADTSLRDQISADPTSAVTTVDDEDYVLITDTAPVEASSTATPDPSSLKNLVAALDERTPHNEDDAVDACSSPIEVLGDISGKTITTTVDTADATMKLIDSAMKAGLNLFSKGNSKKKSVANEASALSPKSNATNKQPNPFKNIAPAKTRFKWRRNPVPARFLGVQDHIIIRDITEHKIFLNMSTSEVLCTTSAEALAMGKFVILPRHCSNSFFLQFPNCLPYDSWDECLEQLQFALKNEPATLSDEHRHVLSWEGATERLIESSAITRREFNARKLKGLDIADAKAAQFHVDAGTKSSWIRKKILT